MKSTMSARSVMLTVVLVMVLVAIASAVTQERISVLYLHRSVGESIIENCLDPRFGPRNIREVLDTLKVSVGDLQSDFVFRTGNLNGPYGPPVSETTFTGNCGEVPIAPMYSGNSTKIWYNGSSPLLQLFSDTSKANAVADGASGEHAWDMFRSHQIRTSASDPTDVVTEKYDLVIIKQPYIVWTGFTQERANQIKEYYRAIVDSVKNHPELNFAAAFGTPLCYEEPGGMDFSSDTSMARLVYRLAIWFRDSLDVGDVPNFWAFDCYTHLCETQRVQNRYCLKNEYWGGPTSQSHLSNIGAAVAQDTLIAFIKRATVEILAARSGTDIVTRQDIDLKIKAFREGQATAQEVIELINRYNSGL